PTLSFTRVVHERIQPAASLTRFFDGAPAILAARQLRGDRHNALAVRFQFRRKTLACLRVAIHNHRQGALLRESARDGGANAFRSAAHEHGFSVKPQIHPPSRSRKIAPHFRRRVRRVVRHCTAPRSPRLSPSPAHRLRPPGTPANPTQSIRTRCPDTAGNPRRATSSSPLRLPCLRPCTKHAGSPPSRAFGPPTRESHPRESPASPGGQSRAFVPA